MDPQQWVKKSGIQSIQTPIQGSAKNGYVQTDLMFGDPEWMKWSLRWHSWQNTKVLTDM